MRFAILIADLHDGLLEIIERGIGRWTRSSWCSLDGLCCSNNGGRECHVDNIIGNGGSDQDGDDHQKPLKEHAANRWCHCCCIGDGLQVMYAKNSLLQDIIMAAEVKASTKDAATGLTLSSYASNDAILTAARCAGVRGGFA